MHNGYIKFWGVRGSRATPESDKMNYGGDTSCVEIRTKENDLIILDMGTGLNNAGKAILDDKNPPKNINIFLSHYHWDHILGFLTFMPIYDESYTINIYGNNKQTSIKQISEKLLDKTFWPVSLDMLKAKINFIELENRELEINNIKISCSEHDHPNGATSYKVNINNFKIVYTTDCEHSNSILNKNVIEFARNADILIHDSHFTPTDLLAHLGWGHSSWEQAAEIAREANVKNLFLFHFSPEYNDRKIEKIEQNAQKIFNLTIAARQGSKVEF